MHLSHLLGTVATELILIMLPRRAPLGTSNAKRRATRRAGLRSNQTLLVHPTSCEINRVPARTGRATDPCSVWLRAAGRRRGPLPPLSVEPGHR